MSGLLTEQFELDPARTHLNHGSFGACPRAVGNFQNQLRREVEADPVHFLTITYEERLYESLEKLAFFVGTSADDLALVPNATHGVNAVLQSLRFSPGDELMVTSHAYNACWQCLEAVAERDGATVVVAELPFPPQDPEQFTAPILERLSEKTRLCLLDHITSPTAVILPVKELTAALQAQGALVLVDGAHAPGMLPLTIDDLQPTYYTGNFHKWLCTPKGAAFLYVTPESQDKVHPLTISHGASLGKSSQFRNEFDFLGTPIRISFRKK